MNRKLRKGSRSLMRSTLLVVGEGADDKAFISHMKGLYCPRDSGLSVKVEAGDGGSAGNVITNAIRKYQSVGYDRRLFLLDADLPPDDSEYKRAAKAGYEIILWQPQCLEGALLDTLGEAVRPHESSQQLKARLHPRLNGAHTDASAYAALFPQQILDNTANASVSQTRDALLPPEKH
ncbi:hypothetical protein [Pseudomonas matsuisoli]|uniref:RloB-like protein n=1 Tax=Pseudomonas matsuisoli TaxID=1515666 RepID=A0A917UZZ1_9PSED|nr:hypothetical protein [Pseudomonas matsuisoli]GGK02587.1 hypothetical protein GCM10009304_30490 [Pseudomonas matsuisoli]